MSWKTTHGTRNSHARRSLETNETRMNLANPKPFESLTEPTDSMPNNVVRSENVEATKKNDTGVVAQVLYYRFCATPRTGVIAQN